jgi:hypothetical protein
MPESPPSRFAPRQPKGGRGRHSQPAAAPGLSIFRIVFVFFTSAYLVYLLAAQLGVRGPLERLLPALLVGALLTTIVELLLGKPDESKKRS